MAIEAAPYGIATETPIGNTNPITGQSWGNYAPQMAQQIANNPIMNSTNPYIQAAQATSLGNQANAQAATAANRVNQNTPYGSLNYTQSTDAFGNPVWTANQTLSQPLQELTNTSLAGLQASQANPMYGINPGQTYSDAIMQRLLPIQQQNQDRLQAQLANQGVVPGTEAYKRAQTQLAQQQNDQLTSAITGGMQTGLQAQQLQNQTAANIKNLASPGYVNPYSQAAVSGPEYLTAYNASRAADIAQQNAALARQSATTSGLYGLGGALLQGSGGLGGLVNLGSSAIGGLSNLGSWIGGLGKDTWTPQADTGFASQIASDYYGSTYDPSAGWSM